MTQTSHSLRHTIRALVIVVIAVLTSVAHTPRAYADDPALDKAKEYFRAGAQAYAIGEYAAAVQAFEQAHALAPRPAVLFSIAQAERRQYFFDRNREHLQSAIRRYREYLEADPQGSRKVDAVQALSELEPLAATLALQPVQGTNAGVPFAVTGAGETGAGGTGAERTAVLPTRVMISSPSPGARISLDGKLEGSSPLIAEVESGKHTARVNAPGFAETERDIVAINGALVTLDVALVERPAKLVVVGPEGAQLTIDGRVQGECPFPQPLELTPGTHLVALTKRGLVGVSREQVLQRGQTTVMRAVMPRSLQRTTSLIMLGTGMSAFVAGGVFAYFSFERDRAAQSFLDSQGHIPLAPDSLEQYNAARLERENLRTAALVSVGVGAALTTAGALFFALDGRILQGPANPDTPRPRSAASREGGEGREGTSVSAAPVVGPGLLGFGLRGTF
jgi:hypothetical protein